MDKQAMNRGVTRRGFAGMGLAGVLVRPARGFELPAHRIDCTVVRLGRVIGSASYDFRREGTALTIAIAIDIRVRLGFIPVFHYRHRNTERWQDDRLQGFDAQTDDNGKPGFASARLVAEGLEVTGSKAARYIAPAHALGTTYWNPRTLSDPLINTQHGNLLAVRMADVGPSKAVQADGRMVDATEYRMTGEWRMNLWYDAGRNWSGLQYYAHDGSVVTYEKT